MHYYAEITILRYVLPGNYIQGWEHLVVKNYVVFLVRCLALRSGLARLLHDCHTRLLKVNTGRNAKV